MWRKPHQQAADDFFPGYAQTFTKIGKERGWPAVTRAHFDAQRGPQGALLIGSPEEVAEKIVRHSAALGGVSPRDISDGCSQFASCEIDAVHWANRFSPDARAAAGVCYAVITSRCEGKRLQIPVKKWAAYGREIHFSFSTDWLAGTPGIFNGVKPRPQDAPSPAGYCKIPGSREMRLLRLLSGAALAKICPLSRQSLQLFAKVILSDAVEEDQCVSPACFLRYTHW